MTGKDGSRTTAVLLVRGAVLVFAAANSVVQLLTQIGPGGPGAVAAFALQGDDRALRQARDEVKERPHAESVEA